MRIAVLSLTRDRLDYTKHCFASLEKFAGCEYDHFVLDQGSTDGTHDWLFDEFESSVLPSVLHVNIGINRGMNHLIERVAHGDRDYDVIVKFDNDCELLQPNTLRDICQLVIEGGNVILSPRILGLNNPPPEWGEFVISDDKWSRADEVIVEIPQIGGIFMAVPARAYDTFRYPDTDRTHGLDDVELCWWWRSRMNGRCGYVKRLEANHYETTSGQHARYPAYFARTLAEGKPAL